MMIQSEWDLIDRIRKRISDEKKTSRHLKTGIGDDCAVFKIDEDRYGLITTDLSLENIHFKLTISRPFDIGYKAMSGNISDIAAMGGMPLYAFISLGIPDNISKDFILSMYDGFLAVLQNTGCVIAGGDTSRSNKLTVCITIHGEVTREHLIKRQGAQIKNYVYMTGTTGDSQAGYKLLTGTENQKKQYPNLIQKHLRPDCRLHMMDYIRGQYNPTSMIDISDGLLSDLRHICEESKTGFLLHHEKIPVSNELEIFCEQNNLDPVKMALSSGEEYELLFTSPYNNEDDTETYLNIPITKIGVITNDGHCIKSTDTIEKIPISGYDHFKKGENDV